MARTLPADDADLFCQGFLIVSWAGPSGPAGFGVNHEDTKTQRGLCQSREAVRGCCSESLHLCASALENRICVDLCVLWASGRMDGACTLNPAPGVLDGSASICVICGFLLCDPGRPIRARTRTRTRIRFCSELRRDKRGRWWVAIQNSAIPLPAAAFR
jgi:hypothetical protein